MLRCKVLDYDCKVTNMTKHKDILDTGRNMLLIGLTKKKFCELLSQNLTSLHQDIATKETNLMVVLLLTYNQWVP